ncbi:NAD(P)H-dependent flavin oxidoreductase [Eilatimonas milleporae]|uniref:NAD(P)H-dependent flavin oxidoreductase YrpB (Nitropropane dioxygenase family) n=1 Tax=Eilatimonas milleporae TaxID=911205 RepID=A0A3M0C0J8_9PROT|nr:nitronate monooxygenase [Eilatimonas milleporae]RMB02832.1 NAD(P)H-dependent flavin oxidoreductase YrpB (nitropropane dioxygenase family) [Eilatimonas milleporae]
MSFNLNAIRLGGKDVLPLIEGGKGISVSSGASSGPWAAGGGIGTVSAVNADSYDAHGNVVPQVYHGRTRRDRHEELVDYGIEGSVDQVRKAWELSQGEGLININVLWEMGGAQRVLHGVLERTKELVHGVTCGAGMPYKLAEIAAKYNVHYYPIVSSARAFNALWRRAYKNVSELLGAVVYEDPWRAGGHNGLSNAENPEEPGDPFPRVLELRQVMRKLGLGETPIVMAGGVWNLKEWKDWIDNKELGPIVFQFGTRPLLTRESPISDSWKQKLLSLKPGDVLLQRFSPTGFFSSALKNSFLWDLIEREKRQIAFRSKPDETFNQELLSGRKRFYVRAEDRPRAEKWMAEGHGIALKTPDDSLVFVTPEKADEIRKDQKDCMGCLSQCKFSSWADTDNNSTGRAADPRSFCIQKTLQDVAHGGSVDNNLVFAGHNAFRFANDPFYSNGFIPSVKQLIDRIKEGD